MKSTHVCVDTLILLRLLISILIRNIRPCFYFSSCEDISWRVQLCVPSWVILWLVIVLERLRLTVWLIFGWGAPIGWGFYPESAIFMCCVLIQSNLNIVPFQLTSIRSKSIIRVFFCEILSLKGERKQFKDVLRKRFKVFIKLNTVQPF